MLAYRNIQTHYIQMLLTKGRVNINELLYSMERVKEILSKEPSVIRLNKKVTIYGDLNGEFCPLLTSLVQTGLPEKKTLIFMGNYFYPGSDSLNTILFQILLKDIFPGHCYLLKGCFDTILQQHLQQEVLEKYNENVYNRLIILIEMFPSSVVLNDKVIVINNGIPKHTTCLSELESVPELFNPIQYALTSGGYVGNAISNQSNTNYITKSEKGLRSPNKRGDSLDSIKRRSRSMSSDKEEDHNNVNSSGCVSDKEKRVSDNGRDIYTENFLRSSNLSTMVRSNSWTGSVPSWRLNGKEIIFASFCSRRTDGHPDKGVIITYDIDSTKGLRVFEIPLYKCGFDKKTIIEKILLHIRNGRE